MGKTKYHVGDKVGPEDILFLEERPKKHPNIRRGLFQCPNCGNTFETDLMNVVLGRTKSCGCLKNEMVSKKNFKNLTGQTFGKLLVLEPTDKRTNKGNVIWKCKCSCNRIVYIDSQNLLNGHTQSCGCLISKGERKTRKILQILDINYQQQKTFQNCKNPNTNRLLRFDFYLPEYNSCIEYDGEHHYVAIECFGGEERFKQQQENDQIKNDFCLINNINLIRISYKDYNKIDQKFLLSKIIEG